MIETLIGIILMPFAIISAVFTLALGAGVLKTLFSKKK